MSDFEIRKSNYKKISQILEGLSDQRLQELLDSAEHKNIKSWGKCSTHEIDGLPVFIKKIPLTDLDLEQGLTTVNVFDLPLYYHYGVGSAGFGALRELAIHTMTTEWVLNDECQHFPLMYHSRILPGHAGDLDLERWGGLDKYVEYWNGSSAVRKRIEGINKSSVQVVVFLEHFPSDLNDWLEDQLKIDDAHAVRALSVVEKGLAETIPFLRDHHLIHFDAHFKNILTEGNQLYFTDFGLALSPEFQLTDEEVGFFEAHKSFDFYSTNFFLLYHLVTQYFGYRDMNEWLDALATKGHQSAPDEIIKIVERITPDALIMMNFYDGIRKKSKLTPYPWAYSDTMEIE